MNEASAELLQTQLDRFEELLADLLEISRFDAGAAVLESDPADVRALVQRLGPHVEDVEPIRFHRGLVVDRDEATNVELKDFLNEEGYQAFALSEPDQVVEEIKKGRFQLVLLDVSPPEDPGVELLQRIRHADSDICVVAMTALPTVAFAQAGLAQKTCLIYDGIACRYNV